VDSAIAACAAAKVPLLVVGEGPERARLETIAASAGEVRFAGRVSRRELRDLLATALCYLQPGIEDFGIATVEALACGTPVVALGKGGVLDIVEHRRHGLLLDSDEAPEMAAGIDKIRRMEFNPVDLRSRAEQFSAERFGFRLRELLRPLGLETEGAPV
jgi:glycosyltransferase involved in cell wall biosynthesis